MVLNCQLLAAADDGGEDDAGRRNNPIPISCVMMFLGLEAISDAVGWGLAWLVFHFFSAFRRSLPPTRYLFLAQVPDEAGSRDKNSVGLSVFDPCCLGVNL